MVKKIQNIYFMKKFLFFSAFMLIGSVCLFSCSDDDDDDVDNADVVGTWQLFSFTHELSGPSKVSSSAKKIDEIPLETNYQEMFMVFSPGGYLTAYNLCYDSDGKLIKYLVDEGTYKFGKDTFEYTLEGSRVSGTYVLTSSSLTLRDGVYIHEYKRISDSELSDKLKKLDPSVLAVGTWIDQSTLNTSNPKVLDYKSDGTFTFYTLKLNSDNKVVSGSYRTGTWAIDEEKVSELFDGFSSPTYYTYYLDNAVYTQYVWNKLDVVNAEYKRVETKQFYDEIKGVELEKL